MFVLNTNCQRRIFYDESRIKTRNIKYFDIQYAAERSLLEYSQPKRISLRYYCFCNLNIPKPLFHMTLYFISLKLSLYLNIPPPSLDRYVYLSFETLISLWKKNRFRYLKITGTVQQIYPEILYTITFSITFFTEEK